MAGASDPLEDMLFSEVDEKAVSDLVGSLESQLAGQSDPAAKADENGRAGSVAHDNHHLGKTLPGTGGTTTQEHQQQQHGRCNKPVMRQGNTSKSASPDKSTSSPASSGEPSSSSPAASVHATSISLQSHGASITTLTTTPGMSTLTSTVSISTVANRSQKVASSPCETSTGVVSPRRRFTTPRRSAAARVKSLNGAVTTRRSSSSSSSSTATGEISASPGSPRPAPPTVNTATFTLSSGQSAIALDRGTPTIALRRLPNHIVASIAQNGTSVSALVERGAHIGPLNATAAPHSTNEVRDTCTEGSLSKSELSSQMASVNSDNMSSTPDTTTPPTTTTLAATTTVTTTSVSQPLTSATVAPTNVSVVTTTSICVTGLTTPVTTTMVRPAALSPTPVMVTSAQPRPGLTTPQRIVTPQLIVRPPQQQTTIQLPPGFTIPPGMVLVRTELGQLVMVPQQALAQAQAQAQAQNNTSPRPATPSTGTAFRVTTAQKGPVAVAVTTSPQTPVVMAPQASSQASQPVQPAQTTIAATAGSPLLSQEMQENVKKCKNFLATLIKLASHNSPSPETSKNVKSLVQDLLDAKIEPEEFTSRLQTELKSSPQPYLVPFLKKSLPALRLSLMNNQHSLIQPPQQGVKPVPGSVAPAIMTGPAVRARHPNSVTTSTFPAGHATAVGIKAAGAVGGQVRMPVVITQSIRAQGTMGKGTAILAGKSPMGLAVQISGNQKNKLNDTGGGSFRDDDDINDVASMAGVNLNEESARILATNSELVGTQIRSCKDEAFLHPGLLHRRILETAKKYGVTEVPMEAVTFISHATQSRLRTMVEKVSVIAQHRLDSCKDDESYTQTADARSQLRFFEQLERMEKQRKDEQEREILLKAAKSRSRQEDPEQARLKQKAKEMQQQELAQIRQREANLTALAAIGPRKKRKVDSPGSTPSGTEVVGSRAGSPAGSSTPSSSSRQYPRQRMTRVNLRDLIFYMEQERDMAHSVLLYRALLK
ncbi:transcription initiation factor TFIID subunit 4-like isoform X2 [Eucyclogobius newberryi]|uniref:transcription initiation factor TFIID subunit 4-like isoform X2 n=1 Tax=Eucyclogobius newberryi TaxID=166745 RepID=UPI003B5C812F